VRDIEIVNELLKKYDLVLPVLPSEQRRIYRSKRRTLAVILGKDEESVLMLNAAVRFYYMMRNLGMSVTLASGARAAVLASVLAVLVVAGGSVVLLQDYIYRQGVIAVNDFQKNGIIAASGDLKINRKESGQVSPEVLAQIKAGDELITGESSALFQFSNGAVVKILKHSSVFAASLDSKYQFDLKSGGIITRIPSLTQGASYEIHSPDSIISVKGTEFGVIYENGKTKVFVARGTVGVRYLPDGPAYDVTEGNTTEVNSDKKISPSGDKENLIMKRFSDLNYVESISTKSPGELQTIKFKLYLSDDRPEEEHSKRLTLDEMKLKYGKLDEVTLYNGRKYTGVIISRGGVYKILTPGGVVAVPAKEVKGSRIIQ